MKFYTGSMFPKEYKNSMLIAQKGSWNRDPKQGYNVKVESSRRCVLHAMVQMATQRYRQYLPWPASHASSSPSRCSCFVKVSARMSR